MNDTIPATGIDETEEIVVLRARPRRRHPERDVVILSLLLLGVALFLILTLPDSHVATRPSGWWALAVVTAGFALTEYTNFRFIFRRESIAFSLSEIPLAFALVFLAPVPALVAQAVGSLGVIIVVRRPPFYKLVFNVSAFAFELAFAFVVFRGVTGEWNDGNSAIVVGVIVATGVVGIVSSVLVSVAISRFEGDLLGRIRSELRLAWWLFIVNGTLAGMVIGLALISPLLVTLAVVPMALLWYVIKAFGDLDQRLRDLDAVHGFSGLVGQSLDPDEIGVIAAEETARLLRADGAALVLFNGSLATAHTHGSVGVKLPHTSRDQRWLGVITGDAPQLLRGDDLDLLRGRRLDQTIDEIIVAPIRDQSAPIGLLIAAGRAEVAKKFSDEDVTLMRTLAEQLAASLHKAILHQQIEREARQDVLTGLPNRLAFERALLDVPRRIGESFVIMLDLDRFKEVNDTLGHQAGDELLIEVSRRLRGLLDLDDFLARLAGDEYALVGHRATRAEALELAAACVREVGQPVTLDGLEIVVTASAGIAVIDGATTDAASALRHADIAMFNAKSQRLGVEVYRDEIDRRTPARLSMLGDLRSAIENDDLTVHLQPKLDLSSGIVVGAEALVRWTHPVRGVVSPTQFVRIAEDTGLIKQLTDLMLDRSIATLRMIHDRGYHLGMAVNLSTHDLLDTRLAERVEGHLTANGVDPALLTLEITESSLLIDAPRARATINQLHEVGIRLAIDDFGTGYSSLSYLRRLPVAELKIDQSFVANVLIDEQDEVIVRSTIDLGHNLGLVVVAEGVENPEVLERLQSFGCDIAQGFCISRPLPATQLLAWLSTTSHPSQRSDPLDLSRWIDTGDAEVAPDLLRD